MSFNQLILNRIVTTVNYIAHFCCKATSFPLAYNPPLPSQLEVAKNKK